MDLKGFEIILASGSPRRADLLKSMDIGFRTLLKPVDEEYSQDMDPYSVPEYLARKKASVYELDFPNQILIAADTLVICEDEILGKPTDSQDAFSILKKLSGKTHRVITGVCIRNSDKMVSFSETTQVRFTHLQDSEIEYYIENYKPFDKAGAYGIQEWIGSMGIESIQGSYTNVMGLPTEKLYKSLKIFIGFS